MKRFAWKSFVSFGLLASFLVISVSGVVLYIAPPGRVARWVDWELWRMSLGDWQALHTNFSSSWLAEEDTAPVPHSEALTIDQVAETLVKEPPQVIIYKLERAGSQSVGVSLRFGG